VLKHADFFNVKIYEFLYAMAQSSGVKYNITDELFNLDLCEKEN